MDEVTWHFLIPSRTSLPRDAALNVLLGAHNHTASPKEVLVEFTAQHGNVFETLCSFSKLLQPRCVSHLYFTIPAEALRRIPEDEFLLSFRGNPENGSLIFFT